MKRAFVAAVVALSAAAGGCLTSITDRLDETNARLERLEQKLAESNQGIASVDGRLIESNKKMETIERGFKRLPGFGGKD